MWKKINFFVTQRGLVPKRDVSSKTTFARIPEGTTSVVQYLDTEHNYVFKHHYRKIFTVEVEPNLIGKTISARNKRILVTRMVAKAHALTIATGEAKRFMKFKCLGYLPCGASDIQLRVLPSYKFSPVSSIEQSVQAECF